ncbi:putative leucine-rich repeat-containing protein DDB_G0290503 isoform X2 [Halyomorpha halys]|uniref:putative leucine-rich repeat-containing protein DDB_G0290503 isoform X2 n=1 Tax=Halyomorpha halys TaxID=286706 RepID=UPI0006D4CA33|nr:myosin heavy chain, cardiac muscle isoform-like [Halyomorpha halys]
MSIKQPTLHKRLNDLENELKDLHESILKKRFPFHRNNLIVQTKGNAKKVKKKQALVLADTNTVSHNTENWIKVDDVNKILTHEKDVFCTTTSLTDVTSLSSSGRDKVFRSFPKDDFFHNLQGLQVAHQIPKKRSKFVLNRNQGNGHLNKTLGILKMKPQKLVKRASSEVIDNAFLPHVAKKATPKNVTVDEETEDQKLDLKFLKERIDNVKKKLRDERAQREIAERAISGYRKRLAILEGQVIKTEGQESQLIPQETKENKVPLADLIVSIQKQIKEEYSINNNSDKGLEEETGKTLASLEKELNEERAKRLEAEKMVSELKKNLEESQKIITKLEEGRKLAVAMADQFRENVTTNTAQEIQKLKSEKAALEMELKCSKESKEISSDLVKTLVERAERAEKELIEKMKQCNDFIAKSSINDPEVVKLLEKHKRAYGELQHEKKKKEMELRNRCNGLLKEIEAATNNADKRYREISEMYNEALLNIKNKESIIDKIEKEKIELENELKDLKSELEEVAERKKQQEEQIKSFKDTTKRNDERHEKTKKEYESSKEQYASLEAQYNKLHNLVTEQDKVRDQLRMELEKEKDSVKIKDKMLNDQADTIKCLRIVADNTKKSLDEERVIKRQLMDDVTDLENSKEKLQNTVANMQKILKECEEQKTQDRIFLKELESKVRQKHADWKQQILQLCQEKEKAIQTARFATDKLVKAVNGYESKLINQKKIQEVLNSALKEKNYQLVVAKQQVQELHEEVWKSAKTTEKVRAELQTKLIKACEVCTDIIDSQIQL